MIRNLPIGHVCPNPDQPRKIFDEAKLHELAASIRELGLQQPIKVRKDAPKRYLIVMGERRYRAHLLIGAETIRCDVETAMDDDELAIAAIVENLQRADLSPLEEAHAFQAMIDRGYTAETLARKLGLQQIWRVTERTNLLKLRPEYQDLLAKNQLTPSQCQEMSRLDPENQDRLFRLIKSGKCSSYNALRAAATGLVEAENQGEMFSMPTPTAAEVSALSRLERRIEQVGSILQRGFDDNEIVIARKVDPNRAATIAEQLGLMQRHLSQLEKALRATAAQGELIA